MRQPSPHIKVDIDIDINRRACTAGALLTAIAALAGCASANPGRTLKVGVSTRADVIANQGLPSREWPDADGGNTLEYATQPFGDSCFMFKLNAAGTLQSFVDALQPAGRDRVQPGMDPDTVRRLLGPERSRVRFPSSGEDVWDWTVRPDSPSQGLRFNVHFSQARVLRTSYSIVYRDRNGLLR